MVPLHLAVDRTALVQETKRFVRHFPFEPSRHFLRSPYRPRRWVLGMCWSWYHPRGRRRKEFGIESHQCRISFLSFLQQSFVVRLLGTLLRVPLLEWVEWKN